MNKQLASTLNLLGKATLIVGGTIAGLVLVYTFALMPLQVANQKAKERNLLVEQSTDLAMTKTEKKEEITEDLKTSIHQLAILESKFPEGDPYLWMLRKLQAFESEMPVYVSHVAPPRTEPLNGYPKVPYKATVYPITGSAHYHDFGEFIEQLENSLPFVKITSLELEPANPSGSEEKPSELLIFRMDVSAITKAVTY